MKKIILFVCFCMTIFAKEVVDHNGDKIDVKDGIKRVVVHSGYPLPSIFVIFDGSTKKLVGMPKTSMAAAKGSLLERIFPNVTKISTDYDGGSSSLNSEAILRLNPDVVFYYGDNKVARRLIKNAKLPGVGFGASIYDNDVLKTYSHWIDLMGKLTNKENHAREAILFSKKVEKQILEKVSKLTKKPTAIIIQRYNNGKLYVAGNHFYSQYWLNTTGAINGAKHNGIKEMSLEELYAIDPDIIYISNFTTLLPEDLMQNRIKKLNLSAIKAIMSKKVYKFPLGVYRWVPPSPDAPLSLMWLAKHNQPEVFKYINFNKEIKKFYKKFYGIELSDKDIKSILNPPKEAGDVKI